MSGFEEDNPFAVRIVQFVQCNNNNVGKEAFVQRAGGSESLLLNEKGQTAKSRALFVTQYEDFNCGR